MTTRRVKINGDVLLSLNPQFVSLMTAFLGGAICGFVVSVPVGPVNLTVINKAIRNGFLSAFMAGAGAIVAESIYAALMLAGRSSLLNLPSVAFTLRVLAVVVIAVMGIRSIMAKTQKLEAHDAAVAERVYERWHHPKAFLLGFILTISNIVLVLLWAALATFLFAHEWVQPDLPSRSICVLGVFCGGIFWFLLLAFFVSRAHRRVKPQTLTFFVRSCGVVFLVFAAWMAYRMFVPVEKPHTVDLLKHAS